MLQMKFKNFLNSSREVEEIIGVTKGKVEEGKQVTADAIVIFNEIADTIKQVAHQANSVMSESKKQEVAVSEVSTAMSRMNDAVQQNNQLTEGIKDIATNLLENSDTLAGTAGILETVVNGKKAA